MTHRPLTFAALAILMTGTALAQTSVPRMRPVIAQPQVTAVKPIVPIDITKRLRPAPRFLTTAELAKGNANLVGKMFSEPFVLSPATPSVPNRGSVHFDNDAKIYIPNPLPMGSEGQATITNKYPATTSGMAPVGAAKITIAAAPNKVYAVDCVIAADNSGSNYINYWLRGGASDGSGMIYLKGGHAIFDLRGAATMQDITLYLYPKPFAQGTSALGGGDYQTGVMDFMGCQITPLS